MTWTTKNLHRQYSQTNTHLWYWDLVVICSTLRCLRTVQPHRLETNLIGLCRLLFLSYLTGLNMPVVVMGCWMKKASSRIAQYYFSKSSSSQLSRSVKCMPHSWRKCHCVSWIHNKGHESVLFHWLSGCFRTRSWTADSLQWWEPSI